MANSSGNDGIDWGAIIGGGLQAGGALLGGMANGRAAQAASQNAMTLGLINDQTARNKAGLEATQMNPLLQQQARQKNAMLSASLPQMQNAGRTASGARTGGIMNMIPQGGYGADVQAFFSPEARAQAEGDFATAAAPFKAPTNLSAAGYGAAGATAQAPANAAWSATQARNASTNQAVMNALQNNGATAKKGSWWKKAIGIAAPIVLGALIPGAGAAIGGAIGGIINRPQAAPGVRTAVDGTPL